MIKLIVCFKLKDNRDASKNEPRDILLSMEGRVPMVREIDVGVDFLKSARSYDIILQVKLDDAQALVAYQEDPYHVDVVKNHMHSVMESSIALDYVID